MFRGMRSNRPLAIACGSVILLLMTVHLFYLRPSTGIMSSSSSSGFSWWNPPSTTIEDESPLASASNADDFDEKYLTFVPHSGLFNQRIAIINAAILAYALNRTLLLPEINLGTATFWRPTWEIVDKLDRCPGWVEDHKGVVTTDCYDYRDYVPAPVEFVFDLWPIQDAGVRTLQRHDMRRDYFQKFWGISLDDPNMAYQLLDDKRYSYQIHDMPEENLNMFQFNERIDLKTLEDRKEPFLVFGSLFGSNRLALNRPELKQLRERWKKELIVNHPLVLQQAAKVIERLGGTNHFASVHLRQGDGFFKKWATKTIAQVKDTLETEMQNVTQDRDAEEIVERIKSIKNRQHRLQECITVQDHHHPQLRLIYVATDAKEPRRRFSELYDEFACLFSLHDFPDVARNTVSAQPLGPRLLPLVDAEVAAHGDFFVPTPKSTFSGYIKQRHLLLSIDRTENSSSSSSSSSSSFAS
ncbi:hypothetical protein BCR43DRAFT_498142 [Syncephalastrum racemosum]|uniref:GDP-fucose protein O-fucosyltransferase-domain-containing protein n=1 Tax=Syncephalastrum racemosum TaxID=13706 RepID=A0A1X2H3C9_SYNRA|nr:hypothetical protein BCR43DRAFT_498142 [Syncephalastrum racemosum]